MLNFDIFRACRTVDDSVSGPCATVSPFLLDEEYSGVNTHPAISSTAYRVHGDEIHACKCLCADERHHSYGADGSVVNHIQSSYLGNAAQSLQAPGLVQDAMETFTRTLMRGINLEVLLDDGAVFFPETSLNEALTHLILEANDAQRCIPFTDVETVATPRDLINRNIQTAIQPHLDERCCTLILKGFEFVTFRLDTERHRDYFAACLALLMSRSGRADASVEGLAEVCRQVPSEAPGSAATERMFSPRPADAGAGVEGEGLRSGASLRMQLPNHRDNVMSKDLL